MDSLSVTRNYLAQWKRLIDSKGVWVIEPYIRLFDSIAFSNLNRAYRLSQACLVLIDAGHSDEAFAISRSIIECSLNLRYLTLDHAKIESRSKNYINFLYCEKKHFLEQCRKHLPHGENLNAIESFVAREGIETNWAATVSEKVKARNIPLNDWKAIEGGEWSGWKIATETHPLDNEINEQNWIKRQFTADYRNCSAMVHCTIRSLENTVAKPGVRYKVSENLKTVVDHTDEPLIIIVTNLYLLVRYVFYGCNVDGTEYFDQLFKDTSARLYLKQELALSAELKSALQGDHE